MKLKIFAQLALVISLITFTGCYKDVRNPGQDPTAPPQAVSFSGDLLPLFVTNCATTGCHDAAPAKNPSLTAGKAYNALTGGGYVNILIPSESRIYTSIKSGSMPPAGVLRSPDIQKVLDWIRNGAPNN